MELGLPCALAINMKGHDVMGYDINPNVLQKEHVHYKEAGPNGEPSIEPILKASASLEMCANLRLRMRNAMKGSPGCPGSARTSSTDG